MRIFRCARCDKSGHSDKFVYSRFTHYRYCIDTDACERRIKRMTNRTFDRGYLVGRSE